MCPLGCYTFPTHINDLILERLQHLIGIVCMRCENLYIWCVVTFNALHMNSDHLFGELWLVSGKQRCAVNGCQAGCKRFLTCVYVHYFLLHGLQILPPGALSQFPCTVNSRFFKVKMPEPKSGVYSLLLSTSIKVKADQSGDCVLESSRVGVTWSSVKYIYIRIIFFSCWHNLVSVAHTSCDIWPLLSYCYNFLWYTNYFFSRTLHKRKTDWNLILQQLKCVQAITCRMTCSSSKSVKSILL